MDLCYTFQISNMRVCIQPALLNTFHCPSLCLFFLSRSRSLSPPSLPPSLSPSLPHSLPPSLPPSASCLPHQTVFHSQFFMDGAAVGAGKVAVLKYIIHNVATGLAHSQLPPQLHYCITDTAALWKIQDSHTGVLNTPTAGKSGQVCIQAIPSKSGTLTPPRLTFSVPRVGSKVKGTDSKLSDMVALTPAQVYEMSLGETVTVG